MINNYKLRIAVVIPTYDRPDGRTPFYLARAVNSILNQTFKKYQIYIIGDNYEDESEIKKYAGRAKVYNLPKAKERSVYKEGSYELWCAGGVNANNFGINIALSQGFNYICHLDHDDYWTKHHLKLINLRCEEGHPFICTKSTYKSEILPKAEEGLFYPLACGLVHSSTCIDFSRVAAHYRDVFEETGTAYPADADMWRQMSNIEGYHIDQLTCYHETERE